MDEIEQKKSSVGGNGSRSGGSIRIGDGSRSSGRSSSDSGGGTVVEEMVVVVLVKYATLCTTLFPQLCFILLRYLKMCI